MKTSPAEHLYNVFRKALGGPAIPPAFDRLPEKTKEAWQACAAALDIHGAQIDLRLQKVEDAQYQTMTLLGTIVDILHVVATKVSDEDDPQTE